MSEFEAFVWFSMFFLAFREFLTPRQVRLVEANTKTVVSVAIFNFFFSSLCLVIMFVSAAQFTPIF